MLYNPLFGVVIVVAVLILAAFLIPSFIKAFLRDVRAGTIRMVTWWGGSMKIYRGPGKSFELPLLTNGTTISSKAINVDLDITDQTATSISQVFPIQSRFAFWPAPSYPLATARN
jgi:uncharacterized membrane protein YqiK